MFFYYIPSAVLMAASIIPALALLVYVYRQDRIDKEPLHLLGLLILYGIVATVIAKVLERLGLFVVNHVAAKNTVLYDVLLYFVVVGFAEEGAKYFLLRRRTWGIREFNCRFDGVVYAVAVSLGFALWENIGYVFMYGLGTALIRAVTAVPGHACFGVFMGCWYGQAYALYRQGDAPTSLIFRVFSVILPALLHGAYDFLAVTGGYRSQWVFVGFVAALFLITFALVRRLSQRDRYI